MRLNGELVSSFEGSVDALIVSMNIRREGVAVAINGEIVPRSEWASTKIEPQAEIEIVTAAAGG